MEDKFEGFYLHLSKELINQHRYLFKNYLEYGYHEGLYLTKEEEREVTQLYEFLLKHYQNGQQSFDILLASVNLLLNMVESYYKRQFETETKMYNPIVGEFQQLLNDYYKKDLGTIPTVHYFADKMHLTPNYLGDVIKSYTQKSAIETIHELITKRAKNLLLESQLSNKEIAFELGFDYPNYFAKFFKKQTQLSPKQFRLKNSAKKS